MRPFRFFFGLSLAIIIFFFLARFIFLALVIAAVMSTAFFLMRKLRNFFTGMTWRERRRNNYDLYDSYPSLPSQRRDFDLAWDRRAEMEERFRDFRTIKIQ